MNERRTAVVVTDGERVLICHAPNKRDGDNTWDLPKGHCEVSEDHYSCGMRELAEETGLTADDMDIIRHKVSRKFKYRYDEMKVLFIYVRELPTKELTCTTYFETNDGKQLPEVNKYEWCKIEDLHKKLYTSHLYSTLNIIDKELVPQTSD